MGRIGPVVPMYPLIYEPPASVTAVLARTAKGVARPRLTVAAGVWH